MDNAYDHIQEEIYPEGPSKKKTEGESSASAGAQPTNFNSEVQEAYKAISSSPWAAKLGGFWQTAKKQASLFKKHNHIAMLMLSPGRTILRHSNNKQAVQGSHRRRLEPHHPCPQPLRPGWRIDRLHRQRHNHPR